MPDPVRTTCPYCGVGCGVLVDGTAVAGDPAHPANRGRLCSKGSALGETLGLDGRLLTPRIKKGVLPLFSEPRENALSQGLNGKGVKPLFETGWDAALDLVAGRFAATIREHGPDAVAFYVSGQLLTEDYYVANKLMKGFIGSGNIDTNSRLCMASTVAGQIRAFGEDLVPGCYEDLELADLIVLVGSNTAWCHPVLFRRLKKTARTVVIDPRRTATAAEADLHLPIASGSDVLLFHGLLGCLQPDRAYIARHTSGYEAALADAPDIETVARGCGVAVEAVRQFYDWFSGTPRTVTAWSQGVNQSSAGTDKVNAIINCHLATGRIGKPGASPFSLTGQPNAMGGREVGGLATQLAAHVGFDDPAGIDRVGRFWGSRDIATKPGLKAVDMFDAVADGRIRAVWIMATNPAVSLPNAGRVRRGLEACDFVVVSDCVDDTDTAALADVLLPAAAWGEKDGTVTNSERRISRQRAFRQPPGLARPDWWMVTQVARRMGFADAFAYERPAEIFREHAALSAVAGRRFDLGHLGEIDEPVQWGGARLFADGRFSTPDGRARFVPVRHQPPQAAPLVLNTGRLRDQWHTMTRTGAVPRLAGHAPEPVLDLHPSSGLPDGALARIESAWGSALARIRLTPDQAPGTAFLPMHWSDAFTADCAAGRVVSPAVDPWSGQPALKHTPIAVRPVEMAWTGFAISRRRFRPAAAYWTRIAAADCWIYELAGQEPPQLRELIALGAGMDLLEYVDAARGVLRLATVTHGRIAECLFIGPMPARDWLVGLFAKDVTDADRYALLSGRSPTATPPQGRIVCACFQVGLARIVAAIRDRGIVDTREIGALLGAGTNCGSCLPELKAIIAHERPVAAA